MADVEKLLQNLVGRIGVSDRTGRMHAEKADYHTGLAEEKLDDARRYAVALDVIKEILDSGELDDE